VNLTILRALLLDALYQVLDNKVFRILGALVALLVVASFTISVDAEGVSMLFGLWRWDYPPGLYQGLGLNSGALSVVTESVAAYAATWVIDLPSLTIGMFFAIVATAFFLPHVLERGTADLSFSKPVPRWQVLLTAYVAGLLFVGLLAVALSVGVFAGLAVSSNIRVPDLLWSPVSSVYVFAMVYVVSLAAGLLTRSSVAAILITLVFYGGTSCTHMVWAGHSQFTESQARRRAEAAARGDEIPPPQESSAVGRNLERGMKVAHHVLPKTIEALQLRSLVRARVEKTDPHWIEPDSGLTVEFLPEGMREDLEGPAAELRRQIRSLVNWECEFGAVDPASVDARISVWTVGFQTSLGPEASEVASDTWSSTPTANALEAELQRSDSAKAVRKTHGDLGERRVRHLSWEAPDALGRSRRFDLRLLRQDELVVAVATESSALATDPRPAWLYPWINSIAVREDDPNPWTWHRERFGWTAPLEFNAFYSLGSSLAFIAAVLGFCAWRLRRIDF
jgi:ABC-type transport system involved in multi-copper enzyme maturation permease subunit